MVKKNGKTKATELKYNIIMVIKNVFFDKINNSMIANTLKQLLNNASNSLYSKQHT